MKKWGVIILSAVLLWGLAACVGGNRLVESPAEDFRYVFNEELGGMEITSYIGAPNDVVIPAMIEGQPVASIAAAAFRANRFITSVHIPDSVKTIGHLAFSECTSLKSVTIGDGVTSIGNRVFLNCTSLESVTIGSGLTSFGSAVFAGCTKLTNLTMAKTPNIGGLIVLGNILWRVLDIQDGRALILSEELLRANLPFSITPVITWEESLIREWLNGEFYDGAFSAAEKRRIVETTVINDDNPWFGTPGGNDTTDKLFLLSLEEVLKYFGGSGELANRPDDSDTFWGITGQYSSARRAYYSGPHDWYDGWYEGTLNWWLRSPGYYSFNAVLVYAGGAVDVHGTGGQEYNTGIRPAFWLNL